MEKTFYLITQLSQPLFFYQLKRNTEMYEITNCQDEWVIFPASYLSEWPVIGISGRCTKHTGVHRFATFFAWERFPPFPHMEQHQMLSTTTISNIYWLHSCAQLFITVTHPSLQKASSAPSSPPPQHYI